MDIARDSGVRRFVYASSSSVYGVRAEQDVTEALAPAPLTDYSKYKAMCEDVLLARRAPGFETLIVRPATVCGYSPRLRLDLTVNILTNHALNTRTIKVFGGDQMRPNIHIEDMVALYLQSLRWPASRVDGEVFNVGFQNHRVNEIAEMVRGVVGPHVGIVTVPTDDRRSYHISSEKIRKALGFEAAHTLTQAVEGLVDAFASGRVPDAMTDDRYYNIRLMQKVALK